MKCKKCNHRLPIRGEFCKYCGEHFERTREEHRDGCPRCSKKQKVTLGCVMFFVMIAVICVVFFFTNYEMAVTAMNDGEFISAKKYMDRNPLSEFFFEEEIAYIDAGVLMEEGQYLESMKAFDNLGNYHIPVSIIDTLTKRIMDEEDYLDALSGLRCLKNIEMSDTTMGTLQSKIYVSGKKAYETGNLDDAKEFFGAIPSYKHSSDYLKLINSNFAPC